MGLDFLFSAARKDGPRDGAVFVFTRAAGIGQLVLSYFSKRLPARYNAGDIYCEFPIFRITPEAWNGFMSRLRSQADTIEYLSGTVTKARSDDEFFPDDVRDIGSVDMKRVRSFDRWFSETFGCERTFKDGVAYMDAEDRCFGVIADAFALGKWMAMDAEVRRYLFDDRYEVTMGNG